MLQLLWSASVSCTCFIHRRCLDFAQHQLFVKINEGTKWVQNITQLFDRCVRTPSFTFLDDYNPSILHANDVQAFAISSIRFGTGIILTQGNHTTSMLMRYRSSSHASTGLLCPEDRSSRVGIIIAFRLCTDRIDKYYTYHLLMSTHEKQQLNAISKLITSTQHMRHVSAATTGRLFRCTRAKEHSLHLLSLTGP